MEARCSMTNARTLTGAVPPEVLMLQPWDCTALISRQVALTVLAAVAAPSPMKEYASAYDMPSAPPTSRQLAQPTLTELARAGLALSTLAVPSEYDRLDSM